MYSNARKEACAWDKVADRRGGWRVREKLSSRAVQEPPNAAQLRQLTPKRRLEALDWTSTRAVNTGRALSLRVFAGALGERAKTKGRGDWFRWHAVFMGGAPHERP